MAFVGTVHYRIFYFADGARRKYSRTTAQHCTMYLSLNGAAAVGPRRLSSMTYRTISQFVIIESVAIVFCKKVHGIESVKSLIATLAAAFAPYLGRMESWFDFL